ncbi:MAG: 5-deoxy-glucuronate isomerase [Gammaproteobacteria bacterium]|jgi:5-deoxy-glucuronate isomerase|nr:5-deoxy-glucuronate isomerase [Gammaproteobacteria bacterium]
MSKLHVRPHAAESDGTVINVTPASAGWSHVGFRLVRLAEGQRCSGGEPDREACLVLVTGRADVTAGDEAFPRLGGRATPFEDRAPGAVYVPAGTAWSVTASGGDVELAICTAPGSGSETGTPRVIDDARMPREVRGTGTNTRHVRNILPETEPAESLLVVEVVTPGGNWSSYPPHKHDTAVPGEETELEETYYHRVSPPQGFAFQRVYTDDRSLDETIAVGDGDAVLVPRGYHPVGAAHGYDLYYLNVMAGPERRWLFRNDPDHDWIMQPPPPNED